MTTMENNATNVVNGTTTATQPAQLLDLPANYGERLTPQVQQQVTNLVSSINIMDKDFVSNYGSEKQTTLGKFADTMLSGRGTSELGETGELLDQTMKQISNYNTGCVNDENKGFFSKLFASSKRKAEDIINSYKSVDKKIDFMVNKLSEKKMAVSKVYDDFELIFEANKKTCEELTIIIYAGDLALEEAKQRLSAMQTDSTVDPQDIRDFADKIERWSKRLYDLKMTRAVSISLAPQIRSVQNSAQQVEDTIQTTINTSIPLWKTNMAIALGIQTVKTGLEASNMVNDLTNQMFLQISQAGKDLAIESAKANQRGVIDIETVRQVNQNLVEALTESTRITREGIEQRRQNEIELKQLETSLATAIKNIR